MRLQFIPNRSQELFALCDIGFGLYPFGRDTINDAEDAAALLGLSDDHLHGIGGTLPCDLGQNVGPAKRGSHIANRPWKNVKRQGLPPSSRQASSLLTLLPVGHAQLVLPAFAVSIAQSMVLRNRSRASSVANKSMPNVGYLWIASLISCTPDIVFN